MTVYRCELAWLGGPVAAVDVRLTVDGDRLAEVTVGGAEAPVDAVELPGLTIPGLANGHSHAFHRAMRGHTHDDGGSFWTWRDAMYGVAAHLDPDNYQRLARATFAEMVSAGICVVGEFHYVHHAPDGSRYADPNAMGEALRAAAADAGIRMTLLDTCYLHGGLDGGDYRPLSGGQIRFGDGDAERWASRVDGLGSGPAFRAGAAIHSVRAVDPESASVVRDWARSANAPVHIHLSEQPAENEQCLAAHGVTPTGVLENAGLLDAGLTAVHATHLTETDVARLGAANAGCCLCPTTERDLADGIGPARALADAGARLSVGSDSHAVIDLFEEARAVELDSRLDTLARGNHSPVELLTAATETGYESLGWTGGGRLVAGGPADFTTIDMASIRTSGATEESAVASAVFAATAADVRHVVVGGDAKVVDGRHVSIDVAEELASSIAEVMRQ